MSEYMVCKGQFDDLDTLKETLIEFGIKESCIEVHQNPVILNGYNRSDKSSKAEVVIKGKRSGNTYDIGFSKQDGVYVAIMNDMDRNCGLGKYINDGSMLQNYIKNKIVKGVSKRRCVIKENIVTEDGRIRIVISS